MRGSFSVSRITRKPFVMMLLLSMLAYVFVTMTNTSVINKRPESLTNKSVVALASIATEGRIPKASAPVFQGNGSIGKKIMGQSSQNSIPSVGWNRPAAIYGFVHMAKTAGTTINGELAMRYERVCGHKGYSYDAYQTNERIKNIGNESFKHANDSYSTIRKGYTRGRVPPSIMQEIGYEDCDWISFEGFVERPVWKAWLQFKDWPLELHVPCRDPVDHLMSQCNHVKRAFDCDNKTLVEQIERCLLVMNRYNHELEQLYSVKCFDSRETSHYIEWMGSQLQTKRFPAEYIDRETNQPRNRSQECVWDEPEVREAIESYLVQNYDYYRFCHSCIGSDKDLFVHVGQT